MKQSVKKLHKKVNQSNFGKRSIETAVKYLVEECLRINDMDGAKILQAALIDYKNKNDVTRCSKEDEQAVISFLRGILKLSEKERNRIVDLVVSQILS